LNTADKTIFHVDQLLL